MNKVDLIEISKANIDIEERESKTALQRRIEMTETEKRITELQQYSYKSKTKRGINMSKSDKIFEELNYKKYESEKCIQYIRDGIDRIEFYLDSKTVKAYIWNDGYRPLVKTLSVKEIEAISEKAKELKFNE